MPDIDNNEQNDIRNTAPADSDTPREHEPEIDEKSIEETRAEMYRKYGNKRDEDEEERRKRYGFILPRKSLLRAAGRVLLANKVSIALIGLATIVAIIFIVSASYERMGNFTINLNKINLYQKGFSLADEVTFMDPQARLEARAVKQATNIAFEDIPSDLHLLDGNNNGDNYMAYTFYIRNQGRLSMDYVSNIKIEMVVKNVDKAVRVRLYDNDVSATYAKPAADGTAEIDNWGVTTPFLTDVIVMQKEATHLEVGEVHKYTVIIWLEGNDPDCTDELIGGMIRLSMNFDAVDANAVPRNEEYSLN